MQYFYDGQIKRYLNQIIRMLSGIKHQNGDGKQFTVPVSYGNISKQVASIIKDNSDNKLITAPKISVYITGLSLDRTRLGDSSHVSKVHVREREQLFNDSGEFIGYGTNPGDSYTVERLMPTPYKLNLKADIWASNVDQKMQIMEQLMMLFNPSIEIQTTNNFVDWTSLTVVELTDVVFDNRAIPLGADTELDTGSMSFETPIWINPPAKVKRMGIIHDIITNIMDDSLNYLTEVRVNLGGFDVFVQAIPSSSLYTVEILRPPQVLFVIQENRGKTLVECKNGEPVSWRTVIDAFGGHLVAGQSQLFLTQTNGNVVTGTVALDPSDDSKLIANLDPDSFPTNNPLLVNSAGNNTRATIDAIIDPQSFNPRPVLQNLPVTGTRYLILKGIGGINPNLGGANAWATWDLSNINNPVKVADFVANANDLIEWNGNSWEVILDSQAVTAENLSNPTLNRIIYTTNLLTGIQYKFEDGEWTRSFEGEYVAGYWKLIL